MSRAGDSSNVIRCTFCGVKWDITEERHFCTTVDSIKGGRIVPGRLALLEAVAAAARAWDKSGRWQDYRALHEAIKRLEAADA